MFSTFAIHTTLMLVVLTKTVFSYSATNNTKPKGFFTDISIWLLGLILLIGVALLLFAIYIIYKFFKRRRRIEDEGGKNTVDVLHRPKFNIYTSKIHSNKVYSSSFIEEDCFTSIYPTNTKEDECSCIQDKEEDISVGVISENEQSSVLEETDEDSFNESFNGVNFEGKEISENSISVIQGKAEEKTPDIKEKDIVCGGNDLNHQKEQEIAFVQEEFEITEEVILEGNREPEFQKGILEDTSTSESLKKEIPVLPVEKENFLEEIQENLVEETSINPDGEQNGSLVDSLQVESGESSSSQEAVTGEMAVEDSVMATKETSSDSTKELNPLVFLRELKEVIKKRRYRIQKRI